MMFFSTYPKKLLIFFNRQSIWCKLLFINVLIITTYIVLRINILSQSIVSRNCFMDRYLGKKLEYSKLDDILLSERKPTKGKSIFFHETSCSKTGKLKLTARQACAIESAALLNPNFDIFILFASPTAQSNDSISENDINIIELLKSYNNIYLRNVNLWTYASGTPIFDWLKDGQLFDSKYVLSHTSDFLRYLTLWRWGGTYLDLDIILKKSLENIKSNFAGAESAIDVAAGVINVDSNGFGHHIAHMFLNNFQKKFDGNNWGTNGPGVITRVLKHICKTEFTKFMTRERCFGLKVFGKEKFYAIGWKNWEYFFDENKLQESLELTNDSIAIHVWNKMSQIRVIKCGAKVSYGIYAQKYCPKVYGSCTTYF